MFMCVCANVYFYLSICISNKNIFTISPYDKSQSALQTIEPLLFC